MNWFDMPALSSLRAFAAFAETGSVTSAGDALNVSHAAISQQMRNLEAQLNAKLLDRSGRALVLTSQGQQLADALALGFGAIEGAVRDITNADADRPVHISCTPSLASAWLMPRLADFRVAHPEVDLMINPTPDVVALEPGGIDVALRYGEGNWPGLDTEPLLASSIVIVASPTLISDRTINQPSDLTAFPWLDEVGASESTKWLESYGVEPKMVKGRIQVPGNLMLDGARDGQGVIITVQHFVQSDIDAGRLRVLFRARAGVKYYILTRSGVLRAPVKTFVAWLRRQKEADL
ncbi:MAG: LysR family transcriptional regulator [Paracoccaceae bacterium]